MTKIEILLRKIELKFQALELNPRIDPRALKIIKSIKEDLKEIQTQIG